MVPTLAAAPACVTQSFSSPTDDQRIEQELGDDPAHEIGACEVFVAICDHLGLPIDYSKLDNELLFSEPPNAAPPIPPDPAIRATTGPPV